MQFPCFCMNWTTSRGDSQTSHTIILTDTEIKWACYQKWNVEYETQTGMCLCLTLTFRNSSGCIDLDMLEWWGLPQKWWGLLSLSLSIFVCVSLCLCVCLFLSVYFISLPLSLSVCMSLSVYLCLFISVCVLSLCLYVFICFSLSVYSFCVFVFLCFSLSVYFLFVYSLSLCLYVSVCFCLYTLSLFFSLSISLFFSLSPLSLSLSLYIYIYNQSGTLWLFVLFSQDKLYSGSHNAIDVWETSGSFQSLGKIDHECGSVHSLAVTKLFIIAGNSGGHNWVWLSLNCSLLQVSWVWIFGFFGGLPPSCLWLVCSFVC